MHASFHRFSSLFVYNILGFTSVRVLRESLVILLKSLFDTIFKLSEISMSHQLSRCRSFLGIWIQHAANQIL